MAKPGPKTTVGVRLEEQWIELLDQIADGQEKSRSEVARRALQMGLELMSGVEQKQDLTAESFQKLMSVNETLTAKMDLVVELLNRKQHLQPPAPKVVVPEVVVPPKPAKKSKPLESRTGGRAEEGGWAIPQNSKRAQAHFVNRDGAGILYFACGKDGTATEYRAAFPASRRCQKCETIKAKQDSGDRRLGPTERRDKDRPLDSPGRRGYDLLRRVIQSHSAEKAALILGATVDEVKRAASGEKVFSEEQWAIFRNHKDVQEYCSPVGGSGV